MAAGVMSGLGPGGGLGGYGPARRGGTAFRRVRLRRPVRRRPGGFGALGGYWAFRALGAAMNSNSGGQQPR